MKNTLFRTFFLLFLFLAPITTNGQMFSIQDEGDRTSSPFAPYLRAGVEFIDFQHTGISAEDPFLGFTGPAARVVFESGGFNLGLSLGNNLTGIDDNDYFSLSLSFSNPFFLVREPSFGLGIPLQLSTKLTSVGSELTSDEFSQTNLSIGLGGIARYLVPGKFDVLAEFVPSYGFSTASGGFIGGNVFSLGGKARINFHNLIFGKNISLGYDYLFDSYNIDGEEFDYDLTSHTITIGISL